MVLATEASVAKCPAASVVFLCLPVLYSLVIA